MKQSERLTFERVRQWAEKKGVTVERMNRPRMGCKYEVHKTGNFSNVEECVNLQDVVDAVPEFASN